MTSTFQKFTNNFPSSRIWTSDLWIPDEMTVYSPPLYQLNYRKDIIVWIFWFYVARHQSAALFTWNIANSPSSRIWTSDTCMDTCWDDRLQSTTLPTELSKEYASMIWFFLSRLLLLSALLFTGKYYKILLRAGFEPATYGYLLSWLSTVHRICIHETVQTMKLN